MYKILIFQYVLMFSIHAPVSSIPNQNYRKRAKDAPFSKRYLDEPITKQLLGGINIMPYSGNGDPVNEASDLNCDFSGECCWSNVNSPIDQLDWGIASSDADPVKAQNLLQTDPPRAPYLVTASTATSSVVYADLFSCVIQCQTGPGTLTFKHWASPGVKFDVCTVQAGQTQFAGCQTITAATPADVTAQIPESSQPFQIVIVASEFTKSPGGTAMIKDITYNGPVCGSNAQTPLPGRRATGAACGFSCDFESDTLCQLSNSPLTSPGAEWKTQTGKTANWAAGVPTAPVQGKKYAGATLDPRTKAVLQSNPVDLPDDSTLKFRYFESAYGVTLKTCLDSPENCPFSTNLDVSPSDRQWKDGSLPIPKGQHTIYIIGENKFGEHAAVGIDDLLITTANGDQVPC